MAEIGSLERSRKLNKQLRKFETGLEKGDARTIRKDFRVHSKELTNDTGITLRPPEDRRSMEVRMKEDAIKRQSVA